MLKRCGRVLTVVILSLMMNGCDLNRASARYAFMGDSLTEGWALPRINLGVHGNTTAQMLARFPAEIPGHHYTAVFILGGTNDILLGINPAITVRNLSRMVDEARAVGAEPVLAEIPDIYQKNHAYNEQVRQLNEQITALAQAKHLKLVDYYDVTHNHPGYESDGVHMKRRGYLAMEKALLSTKIPF
jgi:acyl-CoA thioesterase-1